MKRKAFILTEILTGMMLQVMFAIVLCGAFYMILNFSTSTQQGFAANDKGQMVITYFDSRIRNAGLGMWGCHGSKDIRLALNKIPALRKDTAANRNLCLPVAITSDDKVSSDGRFYRGNVIVLLYAHKDPNELKDRNKTSPVKLILFTDQAQSSRDVKSTSSNFDLIDKAKNGLSSYINSDFARSGKLQNIRNYAVIERSGIPIYTQTATNNQIGLVAPSLNPVTVYPMSELLNLECQKLYTKKDSTYGYNFVFQELDENGGLGNFYYHTKDILDLYMTLDTRPNTSDKIPIFELRVLVSEGINELGTTSKPKDWPGRWTSDFSKYKVHVSKASWKLYNLAPQFAN